MRQPIEPVASSGTPEQEVILSALWVGGGREDHGMDSLRRDLIMTARLLKVLKEFEGHGIRAVPFKGPALAEAAYGDVALRSNAPRSTRSMEKTRESRSICTGGSRPDSLYFLYFLFRPFRKMGMGPLLQRLPAVLPPSK